ncbi:hypothetical protein [Fluviibacterium sp. S390]|uniref:hypothetical protein n=1 Tax=Fluviibacterium sp. S390 TaxID=3415139 RepID=UPI003C7AD87E
MTEDHLKKFSLLAGQGGGGHPPVSHAAGSDGGDGEDPTVQHVRNLVAVSRRLPNYSLIKAEISAARRDAEIKEKRELVRIRNQIQQNVRPLIQLMKPDRTD